MSDRLLKRFQSQIGMCQASLDKFAADFAKDPAYALSWATMLSQKPPNYESYSRLLMH